MTYIKQKINHTYLIKITTQQKSPHILSFIKN